MPKLLNLIPLWESEIPGYASAQPALSPSLKPFLFPGKQPRAAVIVFPGGGYLTKAPHEAEPVAVWLNEIGLTAFVLDYRVYPYRHPYPMLDGLRAVRLVRAQASAYNLDADRIGILGFSAGGHLASTVGTHYTLGDPLSSDPVERVSSRPDAMVLCYPVITFFEHRHQGCMESLIGTEPPEELRQSLSNELQVNQHTPPTFLFHTANDQSVPVENSLLFSAALSQHQVPFELHIFSEGQHGVGLAKDDPFLGGWTQLCATWFKKIGFL